MVWPMIFCTIWASRPKKGHPRTGIYCYFMFFWHGVYPNVWFFSVYVYQTIHLGLSISLSHSHKELQSPRLNPCCFLPRTSLVSSDHSGVFLGSSDSGYWAENFGGFIMFDKQKLKIANSVGKNEGRNCTFSWPFQLHLAISGLSDIPVALG